MVQSIPLKCNFIWGGNIRVLLNNYYCLDTLCIILLQSTHSGYFLQHRRRKHPCVLNRALKILEGAFKRWSCQTVHIKDPMKLQYQGQSHYGRINFSISYLIPNTIPLCPSSPMLRELVI